jgi:mycothiol synthase
MTPLPAGYTARSPGLDDVAAIVELVRAYTKAVLGFADYTEDDARDEFAEPGFDPERDARLVFDPDGRLVGHSTVSGKGDREQLQFDVLTPDPAVARWLFGWALDRAKAVGRAHGHPRVTVDHGVYRADEPLRALASAHGMEVATTYHRMRIDHDGAVPQPEPPAGIRLRPGTEPGVPQAAHAVVNAAFADHFGHVPESYDTWRESLDRKSTFDWSQLCVAEMEGRAVAVLICSDEFVEEGCGHVGTVGVLPAARGRGVAKFLLRHAFAADAAAGRAGTVLHVDTNNTTPALGVYESVGMRPVLVIDVWRTYLTTGRG